MRIRPSLTLAVAAFLIMGCATSESVYEQLPKNPCYATTAVGDSTWQVAETPDWVVGSYRRSIAMHIFGEGDHEFLELRPGGSWAQTNSSGDVKERGRYCVRQAKTGQKLLILDKSGHSAAPKTSSYASEVGFRPLPLSENVSDTTSLGRRWRAHN